MLILKINKFNYNLIACLVLVGAFAFKAYLIFWQYNFYHLLVPPSPDLIAHTEMIDQYLKTGNIFYGYPPLFHIIVAKISLMLNQPALETLTIISPYFLLIVIPPFYWLVKGIFNFRVAFWATIIYILGSSMPLYNFIDAQYADILGYSIITPFYFLSLIYCLKKKNYWLLFLPLLLFIGLIASHHLSAALVWIISMVALLVDSLILLFQKSKNYFPLRVLVFYSLVSIIFYFIARLLFKDVLITGYNSVINLKPITDNIWSSVQEYRDINQLVTPLVEFLGLAGLVTTIKKIDRDSASFSNILLIVWVILFWIFSRFLFIGLPTRILRELSLPLSIFAGIFIVEVLNGLKDNWQKYIVIFLFSYVIIINIVQVSVDPFLIPSGFSYMSWYKNIDEQKYQFFDRYILKNKKILTNYSNPILNYKLKRAGYNLDLFKEDYSELLTDEAKKEKLASLLTTIKPDYLFIGAKPESTSEDIYFEQFNNYTKVTDFLNKYEYSGSQLVKKFDDGSKLIIINVPKPKKK